MDAPLGSQQTAFILERSAASRCVHARANVCEGWREEESGNKETWMEYY